MLFLDFTYFPIMNWYYCIFAIDDFHLCLIVFKVSFFPAHTISFGVLNAQELQK